MVQDAKGELRCSGNELAISKTRRNLAWEQRNGRGDVGLKRIETRENKCRKRETNEPPPANAFWIPAKAPASKIRNIVMPS